MTVPPAPLSPGDVTGSLTGASGAPVRARVRLAPTPQITPASLAGWLLPVRDADGSLTDYTLDHAALFAAATTQAREATAEFRAWRSTWLAEVDLGEHGTVSSLLTTTAALAAGSGTPLRALPRLDVDGGRVDPATAVVLGDDVEVARQLLRAAGGTGVGLLDVARRGFARTVAPGPDGRVLLAAEGTRIVTTPAGLRLQLGTGLRAVTDAGSPAGADYDLAGWTLTGDGVMAQTTVGDVPLAGTVAGQLLTWLAPGSVTVVLRAVPLTTVFARPLTGLAEVTDLAARHARTIELHTQP